MLRARSTRRAIVALSVCAVLLFPTLADAKRGDSKGKGHGPIAHANKGKGHKQLVTFRLKGTAVAGDPCSEKVLAMSVRHSNRHARGLVGNEVTLDLSNARLKAPTSTATVRAISTTSPPETRSRSRRACRAARRRTRRCRRAMWS